MNLEQGQELHGFTVLTAEPLPEIDGDAYTLSHPVSGAKLLYLRNNDRNKAFSIAFRTPPADDTGVFHILEHSVLCGSVSAGVAMMVAFPFKIAKKPASRLSLIRRAGTRPALAFEWCPQRESNSCLSLERAAS